jgi:hypothetical protein
MRWQTLYMEVNKSMENRAHVRKPITASVEVQSDPGAGSLTGTKLVCETGDISLAGMCLYSSILLPPDTRLLMDLEIGVPPRSFNLLGQVIWCARDPSCEEFKAGIHLMKLPDDSMAWQNAVIQLLIG